MANDLTKTTAGHGSGAFEGEPAQIGTASDSGDGTGVFLIENTGKTRIYVANFSGSAVGFNIVEQREDWDDSGLQDEAVQIPNGEIRILGPYDQRRFNNDEGKLRVRVGAPDNDLRIAALEPANPLSGK